MITTTGSRRLTLTVAAAFFAMGCAIHETGRAVNGVPVSEQVATGSDTDPCDVPRNVLEELGVQDMPVQRAAVSRPTCAWEIGAYRDPSMYYWVSGPTEPDHLNDTVVLAGTRAEIFYESEGLARYIVRLDRHTFDVAYSADTSPDTPTGPEGAGLVVTALLDKYGYR